MEVSGEEGRTKNHQRATIAGGTKGRGTQQRDRGTRPSIKFRIRLQLPPALRILRTERKIRKPPEEAEDGGEGEAVAIDEAEVEVKVKLEDKVNRPHDIRPRRRRILVQFVRLLHLLTEPDSLCLPVTSYILSCYLP